METFWAIIDRQLARLAEAKTAADVMRIFGNEGEHSTFFAGGGGDTTPDEVLVEHGWSYVWREASYHWAMVSPDGLSGITYVEGDIYDVDQPAPHLLTGEVA